MATGNLSFEDAQFDYNDGAPATFLLRTPLAKIVGGMLWGFQTSHVSLNGANREVLEVVGSDIPLVTGLIRYDDDPLSVSRFIRAGQRGLPLTYFPDRTGLPATSVVLELVDPAPGITWQMALEGDGPQAPPDRTIRVTFKRDDESDFPAFIFNY